MFHSAEVQTESYHESEWHTVCVVDVDCLGAKEIDIAATLEHIRDQRINMVRNKVRQVVVYLY